MKIGAIKWFDSIKGFGVIGKPDGTEAFLLSSNFLGSGAALKMGLVLLFDETFERNKTTAKKAHVPTSCKDFAVVMSLYSGRKYVTSSQKVTRKSRWGNPYRTSESRTFDVFELGLKSVCESMDAQALSDCIKNYFLEEVSAKQPQLFTEIFNVLEPQLKDRKGADFPLSDIYDFFGKNLNPEILFTTWVKKEFRLIGHESLNESEDYEIPENVLWENKEKLTPELLKRIVAYTFGQRFCENYIEWLCGNSIGYSLNEFLAKSPFKSIEIIEESDKYLALQGKLNQVVKEVFSNELEGKCGQVTDANDSESFENLFSIIPSGLPEELKNELRESIKKSVIELCTEDVAFQLWQKGKIDNYNFNKVKLDFEDEDLSKHSKIFKLLKSDDERIELLRQLISSEKWEYMFDLLEGYLKSSNGLGYSFSLQGKLHELEYWNDKKGAKLVEEVISQIDRIDNQELKAEFFKKSYSNKYSQEFVFATLEKYSIDEIEKFLSIAEESFSLKVLSKRIELFYELKDLRETMNLGLRVLSSNSFQKLDRLCFKNSDLVFYFELWKEGLAGILPERHIISILDDNDSSYEEVDEWLKKGLVKSQVIEQLMFDKLLSIGDVDDRIKFYTSLNLIQKLVALNQEWINKVYESGSEIFQIILWFLEKRNDFNFDVLKRKFIYFKPDGQVQILKRLFSLKVQGLFDLSIDKLQEIKRTSLDIFKLNEKLNPHVPLDLTTDLIIESLTSYSTKNKFLVETELIRVVLQNLYGNSKRKFKIGNYFERCLGRLEGNFNWGHQSGTIKRIPFGEGKSYFKIEFDYDEHLVQEIRKLPGRKWNKEELFWGVPSRSEKEVLEFARQNRFFLDFEGSNYENNTHFADFERKDIPRGVTFCEGRVANKEHKTFKKKFWWCANQPCFENCETIHKAEDWKGYTLLDFCKILGFNLDEENKYGAFPNGHYYQFISKINRFNRLLERIYCRSCEHILYPDESSNYAAYTVVRFSCKNNNCLEHGKLVYLNHCLNGKCNSIIDSRDSKKCNYHDYPNFAGLYICGNCGSCCSDAMLSRRLGNLELTGGLIHSELRVKVEEKLGHLERAEYFCYKCGNDMVEHSSTLFRCDDCEVEYDLNKFRLNHPNKHLRRKNYPTAYSEEL